MELIKPDKTEEFFCDITFKIIPSKFLPYKLFVISSVTKPDKKPKLISMILTKNKDN